MVVFVCLSSLACGSAADLSQEPISDTESALFGRLLYVSVKQAPLETV
jgi:hypothetical protein